MRTRRFSLTSFFLAVCCLLCLPSCGSGAPSAADAEMALWLENAALDAQDTPETLYERALAEDTLVIYSTTTRTHRVKESFEAAYPGLTVEVYDTRAYDLIETVTKAYENGQQNFDVIICSNDGMSLTQTLLPKHILNKYVPWDIAPMLREGTNETLLYFTIESVQLVYNTEAYDACPVDNWWELTEPQWYGKIYMNSPLRSFPAYAMLHAVLQNSDAMEDAYMTRYGKPLAVPANSSAGKVFFERLMENGLQLTSSSTELVEIVGAPGQTDPPLAFMISSKVRRTEIGLHVAAAYGIAPCDGVYSANSVSIAGGAKNTNTAKLFIRWLLGETDGTGEGLKPYLTDGAWPVRTDVESDAPKKLDECNFWINSEEDVVSKQAEYLAFWNSLQSVSMRE